MAVTGQKVYELALALIDEVTVAGAMDQSDLAIKAKAKQFLTMLQAEMVPNADEAIVVDDLADPLILAARECLRVLPYGLAAHLIVQDDPASASFFQQRYEELKKTGRATIRQIVQVLPVNGESVPIDGQPAVDGEEDLDGGSF